MVIDRGGRGVNMAYRGGVKSLLAGRIYGGIYAIEWRGRIFCGVYMADFKG